MQTYEVKFVSGLVLFVTAESPEKASEIAEQWNRDHLTPLIQNS